MNIQGIKVIVGGGIVAQRPTWTETIPDWIPTETAAPRYLQVAHDPKIQIQGEVEVGVQIVKGTTVVLSAQKASADGDMWPAIYHGWTTSLSLRQEFE